MQKKIIQKILLLLSVAFLFDSCVSQTERAERKEKTKDINYTNRLTKKTFPEPIGYVNDFASILDSMDILKLEAKLQHYDKRTTNQIVIVTLDSEERTDDNFDEYALELSKYWGVGTKEKNNGLTIVFDPGLRRIRINTGLGTEKILTDEICERVLQTLIVPAFRTDSYFEGLDKATNEFIKLWD